jgi:hypothetical protein
VSDPLALTGFRPETRIGANLDAGFVHEAGSDDMNQILNQETVDRALEVFGDAGRASARVKRLWEQFLDECEDEIRMVIEARVKLKHITMSWPNTAVFGLYILHKGRKEIRIGSRTQSLQRAANVGDLCYHVDPAQGIADRSI